MAVRCYEKYNNSCQCGNNTFEYCVDWLENRNCYICEECNKYHNTTPYGVDDGWEVMG